MNDDTREPDAASAAPRISIVGTGPAGLYTAQTLLRALPAAELTLWDRRPRPYGLIHEGVAADHPHTKRIARQFDRLWQSPHVRFAGGVTVFDGNAPHAARIIGSDRPSVSLETLRHCFDAVVLATGRIADRALPVPGGGHPTVRGAGTIARRLNGAPDAHRPLSGIGSDVVLVGAGNVALDVLRFLVKTEDDYSDCPVDATALAEYTARPAQRITVLARSGIAAGTGDPQMWRELVALPRGIYRVHEAGRPSTGVESAEPPAFLPGTAPSATAPSTPGPGPAIPDDRTAAARLEAVAALTDPEREAALPPGVPQPQVDLYFGAIPLRIEPVAADAAATEEELADGGTGACTVDFDWRSETRRVCADSIITAIGFDVPDDDPLASAAVAPTGPGGSGRLAPDLYRTGWLKRGPVGAIPENRACAKSVAQELLDALAGGELHVDPSKPGFAGVDAEVRARCVTTAR